MLHRDFERVHDQAKLIARQARQWLHLANVNSHSAV
jgi:hypothetical protein